jgi:uncharacterized membrane protein YgcG
MIYKCLALFNLLSTSQPHIWLIAADWLEEEGLDVTANAFRENLFVLEIANGSGQGYGDGYGYGYGSGFGGGDGDGGSGRRYGHGVGFGSGDNGIGYG